LFTIEDELTQKKSEGGCRMIKSESTISRFVPLSIIFLIFFVSLLIASESFAVMRFVSASGTDLNTPCNVLAFPCRQISFAIGVSGNGDQIKVEAGGYEHFTIDGFSNLSVIGGYLPGSGFAEGSRSPFHQTFVSGDINDRAVVIEDSFNITLDSLVLHLGNAITNMEDDNCRDDNGLGDNINAGGCLLVTRTGGFTGIDLDINSCRAVPGSGGGFAWCDCTECELRGSIPFSRCVIENNDASVTDTNLTQNIGGGGGLVLESDGGIVECDIRNNETDVEDLQGSGDGGGLFIVDSTLNINDSTIENNRAHDGAGIKIVRVDMDSAVFGNVLLADSIVKNNQAKDNGGGINCENSSLQVVKNTFFQNEAGTDGGGSGGGCYANACNLTLYANIITFNSAENDGGGCFATEDSILKVESDFVLQNKTNEGDGGGLGCDGESDLIIIPTGDGIFDGTGTIFPTVVNGNVADIDSFGSGRGGGVFATLGCRVTIGFPDLPNQKLVGAARTQINNNAAFGPAPGPGTFGSGGGIYIGPGSFLDGLDFDVLENIAIGNGGGISFDNIEFPFALAEGDITRGNISNNRAFNPGGGIMVGNLCCPPELFDPEELQECQQVLGFGLCGGKLFVRDSDINGNTAEANLADDFPCAGGGISFGKGNLPAGTTDADLTNVCITQNVASGQDLTENGGGICITKGSNVNVLFNTIADNQAGGFGGGVFITGFPSTVDITNTIVRFNHAPTPAPQELQGFEGRDIWCGDIIVPPFVTFPFATLDLVHTITGGSWNDGGAFIPPSDVFIGDFCNFDFDTVTLNKRGADPLFVNPGVRNYHLRTFFSPAVDMATNAGPDLDKEMTPRECASPGCGQGGTESSKDIGALEFKEFPCTDNCNLPECVLTPECITQGCDETADAQGNVDCFDNFCENDPRCQEGLAFANCQDGKNNNPQDNLLTDCADPLCEGAVICQPAPTPTPTPTAPAPIRTAATPCFDTSSNTDTSNANASSNTDTFTYSGVPI
jgi:predicted outer membrane repeat protein